MSKSKLCWIIFCALISASVIILCNPAKATISGVHGYKMSSIAPVSCNAGYYFGQEQPGMMFIGSACSINLPENNYVPESGQWKVRTSHTNGTYADTATFYLDETIPINEQDIHTSGSNVNIPMAGRAPADESFCYALISPSGKRYRINSYNGACTGYTPLPPNPPVIPTSCTINNSNALTVDLGTIDRTELPIVPGSGTKKSITVPVSCSGGIDVNVIMKMKYTPITIGSNEVIKSSTNGLGITASYNNTILSTTSNITLALKSGSNTLNFEFDAVRSPSVSASDIETGPYTANAVLEMTQQ
ncbi:fimbrial protein [Cronobacter dublinensis]